MHATEEQLATIRARAVNGTARAMMRDGVTMTWEQADELGAAAIQWIESRLDMVCEMTTEAVVCTPRVTS